MSTFLRVLTGIFFFRYPVPVNLDWIRQHCLSFPGVTEQVQWGGELVFKIGAKMFAVAPLEPGDRWLSFKASPEEFAELTEVPGVVPAAYLARAKWVSLETGASMHRAEVKERLRRSYHLVLEKLPKRQQAELAAAHPAKRVGTKPAKRPIPNLC